MENDDGAVAQITLNTTAKRVAKVDFHGKTLRFSCQRCAVFCCKLGGPKLSASDIERLKQKGYDPDVFLDVKHTSLRNIKNGSCIFLSSNVEESAYYCSVYAFRPTTCKLYPFYFEEVGTRSYALKVILCCNGLNAEDGELIDEKFFIEFLQSALFDLIRSKAV